MRCNKKIKNSKKCDGENDCPGDDEKSFLCDIFKRRNESKFKSNDQSGFTILRNAKLFHSF